MKISLSFGLFLHICLWGFVDRGAFLFSHPHFQVICLYSTSLPLPNQQGWTRHPPLRQHSCASRPHFLAGKPPVSLSLSSVYASFLLIFPPCYGSSFLVSGCLRACCYKHAKCTLRHRKVKKKNLVWIHCSNYLLIWPQEVIKGDLNSPAGCKSVDFLIYW